MLNPHQQAAVAAAVNTYAAAMMTNGFQNGNGGGGNGAGGGNGNASGGGGGNGSSGGSVTPVTTRSLVSQLGHIEVRKKCSKKVWLPLFLPSRPTGRRLRDL